MLSIGVASPSLAYGITTSHCNCRCISFAIEDGMTDIYYDVGLTDQWFQTLPVGATPTQQSDNCSAKADQACTGWAKISGVATKASGNLSKCMITDSSPLVTPITDPPKATTNTTPMLTPSIDNPMILPPAFR